MQWPSLLAATDQSANLIEQLDVLGGFLALGSVAWMGMRYLWRHADKLGDRIDKVDDKIDTVQETLSTLREKTAGFEAKAEIIYQQAQQ
ncbi:hypothetical protein [Candidatus Poriferisodalis sp.]|uniref:hypothetical protein n=1 Tax=Candidatus Poriferisodalis sp. TaxID=3101277 RepID=UPI003B02538D